MKAAGSMVLLLSVLLVGCGQQEGLPSQDEAFIAFARDFRGYLNWEAFPLEGEGVGTHTSGPRTVYLNHLPESGRADFAVGTIFVKTMHVEGETEPVDVFAMVKRGQDYNIRGALGWEWFELSTGDEPEILWRGVTPPGDGAYGGISQGSCNSCHVLFVDNDSVGGEQFTLDAF